jgi:leader peptidase (prepilin peptidase) / N-methyltransferase
MANIILPFFAFLLGSAVGSFLNVCIYRLPRDESLVLPCSHCPTCSHPIQFYDNIPIISYLLLRGRCRSCGMRISLQYPLVEALTASLSLVLFLHYSLLEYAIYFVFASSLIVVAFIDLEHQIIPCVISIPGIVAGFLASFVLPRVTYMDSLLGILLGGGILYAVRQGYYLIKKTEGMGLGDVELLAMIGAFLGSKSVPVTIFTSAVLGSLVGLTIIGLKKKDLKYAIPYGPFIVIGAFIYLFWGDGLVLWYHNLLSGK